MFLISMIPIGKSSLLRSFALFIFFFFTGPGMTGAWAAAGAEAGAEPPANLPDYFLWRDGLRREALEAGIRPEILYETLAGVQPDMTVINRDRNQPEVKQTFADYSAKRLSAARIAQGRQKLLQYEPLISKVANVYGVPPHVIAAIWGLESNYGSLTGGRKIIPALVTLAYDPRRSGYFRKELLKAFRILEDGNIAPDLMTGSWAGAMGQPQFMPSAYLAYAQDFTGDGHKDIWTSEADVFASIANYLKQYGWDAKLGWGRPVQLPEDFAAKIQEAGLAAPATSCALKNHVGDLTLTEWQQMGVRQLDGEKLPDSEIKASLVRPDGPDGAAFLAYGNYRAFLRYNCSDYYALSIGMLADQLEQ